MSNRNKKDRRLTTTDTPSAVEFNMMAAFRKSPLPPPAELEKYEVLYPGATKLLFDNFISQTNHRMELEKEVIRGDIKRSNTSQRNSFFIMMAILLLAFVLFILGKDGLAIAAVFTAITPVLIAFVTSSISRKKERNIKRQNMGI